MTEQDTSLIIYHNEQCSKSRGVLEMLAEKEIPYRLRLYAEEPFTETELRTLLRQLGMKAEQLVRRQEALFATDYAGKDLDEDGWIAVLMAHQAVLIERPIALKGGRAVVARPPERLFDIL